MKQKALVAPFYKGLVNDSDPASLALITKKDPTTGADIPDDAYIKLVEKHKAMAPELVQDVARVSAAAVLALRNPRGADVHPRPIFVEGCPQTVGGKTMYGGEIMQSIWENVVPSALKEANQNSTPIVKSVSDCTVREVREILAELESNGVLYGVTHEYHRERVETILGEEAEPAQVVQVYSPSWATADIPGTYGPMRFVKDVVAAGMPTPQTLRKENRNEAFIYKPLHRVSRTVEWLTNGKFNLEMHLAERMRK